MKSILGRGALALLANGAALFAASTGTSASAAATVISASGSGHCYADACNGSDATINNHYANETDGFRNYFSFRLDGATITSATLSIWNERFNTDHGSSTYNLYASTALTYAGMLGPVSLGSVTSAVADTGVARYVAISLNQAGIDALNATGSGLFRFGGVSTGSAEFFGYTDGTPAAFLTVEAVADVPEPASWAMMMLGFGLTGAVIRRHKPAAAVRLA